MELPTEFWRGTTMNLRIPKSRVVYHFLCARMRCEELREQWHVKGKRCSRAARDPYQPISATPPCRRGQRKGQAAICR